MSASMLDWLTFVAFALQWNKPSIDFYEKVLNAKPMSEWMGMRLEVDGITSLKRFAT